MRTRRVAAKRAAVRRVLRVLKWLFALAFTAACAVAGVVVLTTYEELTATLPPIDRLLEYDPPVATRVYAADGSLIEEFYRERRYSVPIRDIPPMVRNAFLAAEDADFYAHHGVDFLGIARAFAANVKAGDVVQGGSTITQQVVKALLLTPERSYERKLKEILLSLRLEQHLSKDEILELYLNQIYLGDGNHGIGAAARNYFGKPVSELTAAQAATLAGLPAAPSRYSPNRAPEAAAKRQRYVLRRMLEEGFLGAGEYQAALRENVKVLTHRQKPGSVRNYYTETVRLQLEDMFGAEAPYNQGYTVRTAMQPRLQELAEVAVRNGIERLDRTLGYRGVLSHLSEAERKQRMAKDAADPSLAELDPERIYEGIVTAAGPGRLEVRVGPHQSSVDVTKLQWSSSAKNRIFRVGDVVEVRTREAGDAKPRSLASQDAQASPEEPANGEAGPRFHLAQTPEIEVALLAIDVQQGGVAAMVGGYDFLRTQFNRALQAQRQPGSAFKPFVYAAALDNGYTAASILQDSPVEYMDHGKLWQPRNYTRDFKGPIRLRTALEQSRNVVSVKIVDAVGVKTVVDYLDRFHLKAKFGANLSLGLGTSEMTLLDVTSGYTTFANGGIKVEPVIIRHIEDKDGNTFFDDEPRRREVMSPQTAAVMTYILEGVIEQGTATSIKALGRPVAGKTGTTNEQRDAWFIGYTPNLVVGVWVGFDEQTRTMGKMGTGGRVAAPIWLDFMKPALEGTPVRDFEMPDGISCVNIDPWTGKRAGEWTSKPLLECFKEGTEPGAPAEPTVWGANVPAPPGPESPGATLPYPDPNQPAGSPPATAPSPGGDPRWPSEAPSPWPDPEAPPGVAPGVAPSGAAPEAPTGVAPWGRATEDLEAPPGTAPEEPAGRPASPPDPRWPATDPGAQAPARYWPTEPEGKTAPPSGGRLRAVPQDSGNGVEIRLFPDPAPSPPTPPPTRQPSGRAPAPGSEEDFRVFPSAEPEPREPDAPTR